MVQEKRKIELTLILNRQLKDKGKMLTTLTMVWIERHTVSRNMVGSKSECMKWILCVIFYDKWINTEANLLEENR